MRIRRAGSLSKFQFHIGAIRRRTTMTIRLRVTKFQFHIGAIRRYVGQGVADSQGGFNSILVQLEAGNSKLHSNRLT